MSSTINLQLEILFKIYLQKCGASASF